MRRKSGPRESTIVNHEEGELKKNHPLLEARHAWVRRGIKLCFENLSTNDHPTINPLWRFGYLICEDDN